MQNDHRFVLVLHGPPDGGQTEVAKALLEGKAGRFRVSTNRVKFLISDYSSEDTDRDMLNRLVFALAQSAFDEGFSLVVEGSVAMQNHWWRNYHALANKTGARFVRVNVEAPYDVLVDRFQRRVARSRAEGTKISISKVSDLQERYDAYRSLKQADLPTFDSAVTDVNRIAAEIEKLIA